MDFPSGAILSSAGGISAPASSRNVGNRSVTWTNAPVTAPGRCVASAGGMTANPGTRMPPSWTNCLK